jgi:hypothetical protein
MLVWDDKDPDDIIDYTRTWTDNLATGETITASEWAVTPAGLTLGTTGPTAPYILGAVCGVWLSGGTVGETYEVRNRITTSRGVRLDATVNIKIKER